jgi:hypothetical protein
MDDLQELKGLLPYPGNSEAVCRKLLPIPGIAKVEPDTEWDNILCLIINVFVEGGPVKDRELLLKLRLSTIAPVVCAIWMERELVIGFGGVEKGVLVGRIYQGKIPSEVERTQTNAFEILHLSGYFVVPEKEFRFMVIPATRDNTQEKGINGAEFYFGSDFLPRQIPDT